jgi:hypothetical protein
LIPSLLAFSDEPWSVIDVLVPFWEARPPSMYGMYGLITQTSRHGRRRISLSASDMNKSTAVSCVVLSCDCMIVLPMRPVLVEREQKVVETRARGPPRPRWTQAGEGERKLQATMDHKLNYILYPPIIVIDTKPTSSLGHFLSS